MHGDVVLHRRAPAELPLVDARATRLERRRRQIGFAQRRSERRHRDRRVVCGVVERRDLRAQLAATRCRPCAPFAEQLRPLCVAAHATRRFAALLMAVGALAHQLFAMRRIADARQHQREPVIRRKLRGERRGIGLALEAQLLQRRGVGRRDVQVAVADAPHAQRRRAGIVGHRRGVAAVVAREYGRRVGGLAARHADHRAGDRRAGRVEHAAAEQRFGRSRRGGETDERGDQPREEGRVHGRRI